MRLPERDERVVELRPRERIVGPEGRDVGSHQAGEHHGRDLRRGPALPGEGRRRRRVLTGVGREGGRGQDEEHCDGTGQVTKRG